MNTKQVKTKHTEDSNDSRNSVNQSSNSPFMRDEILKLQEELIKQLKEKNDETRKNHPVERMKEAIKVGNKNISLTTIGLKRKSHKHHEKDLLKGHDTFYQIKSEYADIVVYHVEKNNVWDSPINKGLRHFNELVRIANLSYYHQSKSEFTLCSKELKLLKYVGIQLPRQSDPKNYFKTREFQVLLKDKALKLLLNHLQKD